MDADNILLTELKEAGYEATTVEHVQRGSQVALLSPTRKWFGIRLMTVDTAVKGLTEMDFVAHSQDELPNLYILNKETPCWIRKEEK